MNEPEMFVDYEPDADWVLDWNDIPKGILDSVEMVRSFMKKNANGIPLKSKENCRIAFELDPLLSNAFRKNDQTERIDLERYKGEYVCTKMLYTEAMGGFGEPDRKAINEINDIMNNAIPDWETGPSSRRFPGYGTQRAWRRKSVNGEQKAMDGFPFSETEAAAASDTG